jgi:hypothetical protein
MHVTDSSLFLLRHCVQAVDVRVGQKNNQYHFFSRNCRIDGMGGVLIELSNPMNSGIGYNSGNDEAVSLPEIFWGPE